MKNFFLFIVLVILYLFIGMINTYGQGVAINEDGSSPHSSSILDISSTDKGILIPRLSSTERLAIASPDTGLLVYDMDSLLFSYFNGNTWIFLGPTGNSLFWGLTGSANTDTAIHFIGTSDNMPIRFKINNVWAGQWDNNNGNYFIGSETGKNMPQHTWNNNNVAIGQELLKTANHVRANILIGENSMTNTQYGLGNSVLGANSLANLDTGHNNIAIGNHTLFDLLKGETNIGIGSNSLSNLVEGEGNIAIGTAAGNNDINSQRNIFIGEQSGGGILNYTRVGNIFIGYRSGYQEAGSNKLYIENSDTVYPLIFGDFENDSLKVYGSLSVADAYTFPTADGNSNEFLQSDGNGQIIWASPNPQSLIIDNDNDTKIEVEQTADEDKIRMTIKSVEAIRIGTNPNGFRMIETPQDNLNSSNLVIGDSAGYDLQTVFTPPFFVAFPANNTFLGDRSGRSTTGGNGNLFLGTDAGYSNTIGSNNVYLGNQTGKNANGSGNVFIGAAAGENQSGSNQLIIDNTNTTTPLVKGDFQNDELNINGSLIINNDYTFPTTDGANGQIIQTDGNGNLTWQTIGSTGNDYDADSTNEIQSLLLSGTDLSISDGNTISLSSLVSNDNDSSNETQNLLLAGTTLYIRTGSTIDNSVDLSNIDGSVFENATNVVRNKGNHLLDDFVFGSSKLNNNGNPDEFKRFFFDKSKAAFRTGSATGNNWDADSLGLYSFSTGSNTLAKGNFSFSSGYISKANANYSIAMGTGSETSNDHAVAIGRLNSSSGNASVSIGYGSSSFSAREIALGSFNTVYTPVSPNTFFSTDRLFVIGNGTNNSNRSDALVMLKNGNTTINGQLTLSNGVDSYTLPNVDGTNGQILQTDGGGNLSWQTPTNSNTDNQNLNLSGTDLSIQNANTVSFSGWDTNSADDFSGNWNDLSAVPIGFADNFDNINDADADSTNEIQNIVLNGTQLLITKGDTLDLSHLTGVFFKQGNTVLSSGDHTLDDFVFGATTADFDGINQHKMFYNRSKNAFRVGKLENSYTSYWDEDSLGINSFGIGTSTRAQGANSFSGGYLSQAKGANSFSLGNYSIASHDYSFAFGNQAKAMNEDAIAIGQSTYSSGVNAIALGYEDSSNAEKSVSIGSFNVSSGFSAFSLGYQNKASGDHATAIGRETEASGLRSIAIGYRTLASGGHSFAGGGENSIASGHYAFSYGNFNNIASGNSSFSFGSANESSGDYSTTFGSSNEASGLGAVAFNNYTTASGDNSIAFGYATHANSYNHVAIGQFNVIDTSTNNESSYWTGSNPVFSIGNGTTIFTRSDAFRVMKSGDIFTGGDLIPTDILVNSNDLGKNTLNQSWDSVFAKVYLTFSDIRLKTTIDTLDYGLDAIMNVNPVSYYFKNTDEFGNQKQLGFIAQELATVVPEVVVKEDKDNPDSYQSVNYSAMIPVLTKAIQEQQEMIQQLKEEIENLKK